MKRLVIKEISNEQGVVEKIQIVEQTHRNTNFGLDDDIFVYNYFILLSRIHPALLNFRICIDGCVYDCGLFLRGTNKRYDNTIISVPSKLWLLKLQETVGAYNKHFGSCDGCVNRHCNSCEFKEKQ